MVRRSAISGRSGIILAAIGLGVMMTEFSWEGFGRVAVLVGVGIEGFRWLDQRMQQRTASQNEDYERGKDVGFERGWQAHEEQSGASRPKVVGLDSRRAAFQKESPAADAEDAAPMNSDLVPVGLSPHN